MPSEWILYHNNRCSKSRAALALLESRAIEAETVHYLTTPPDLATLTEIFRKLGLDDVRGMMRVKDDLYKELGLNAPDFDNDALLAAIAEHLLYWSARFWSAANAPRSAVLWKTSKHYWRNADFT